MKPADSTADADLVVSPASAEKLAQFARRRSDFTIDEKWSPSLKT